MDSWDLRAYYKHFDMNWIIFRASMLISHKSRDIDVYSNRLGIWTYLIDEHKAHLRGRCFQKLLLEQKILYKQIAILSYTVFEYSTARYQSFLVISWFDSRRMPENGFAPPPLGNFADIANLVEN